MLDKSFQPIAKSKIENTKSDDQLRIPKLKEVELQSFAFENDDKHSDFQCRMDEVSSQDQASCKMVDSKHLISSTNQSEDIPVSF
jgi:hypothetical protein